MLLPTIFEVMANVKEYKDHLSQATIKIGNLPILKIIEKYLEH
jgi:hypothetical protein